MSRAFRIIRRPSTGGYTVGELQAIFDAAHAANEYITVTLDPIECIFLSSLISEALHHAAETPASG